MHIIYTNNNFINIQNTENKLFNFLRKKSPIVVN